MFSELFQHVMLFTLLTKLVSVFAVQPAYEIYVQVAQAQIEVQRFVERSNSRRGIRKELDGDRRRGRGPRWSIYVVKKDRRNGSFLLDQKSIVCFFGAMVSLTGYVHIPTYSFNEVSDGKLKSFCEPCELPQTPAPQWPLIQRPAEKLSLNYDRSASTDDDDDDFACQTMGTPANHPPLLRYRYAAAPSSQSSNYQRDAGSVFFSTRQNELSIRKTKICARMRPADNAHWSKSANRGGPRKSDFPSGDFVVTDGHFSRVPIYISFWFSFVFIVLVFSPFCFQSRTGID